jgi:hypothetical protein
MGGIVNNNLKEKSMTKGNQDKNGFFSDGYRDIDIWAENHPVIATIFNIVGMITAPTGIAAGAHQMAVALGGSDQGALGAAAVAGGLAFFAAWYIAPDVHSPD